MTAPRTMTDDDLHSALTALGADVSWPAPRDLAPAILARIELLPVPARPRTWWLVNLLRPRGSGGRTLRRSLVLAVLALLAAVALATAFGIGVPGIRILFGPVASPTPTLPAPTPTTPPSPGVSASPGGSSSSGATSSPTATDDPTLGRAVTLAEARSGAGFAVLTPAATGFDTPTAIHLLGTPPTARVSLSFGDHGAVTEFVGSADPLGFQKMIGGGTTVESLSLNGQPAYWISGAPHDLTILYVDGTGSPVWETTTVIGNVLVWQAGEVTLRLVTPHGRAEAVALADSMR